MNAITISIFAIVITAALALVTPATRYVHAYHAEHAAISAH